MTEMPRDATDPDVGSPDDLPDLPDPPEQVDSVSVIGFRGTTSRWVPLFIGLALWAVVVLPLAVALLAQRSPQWFPIADLAQTELRVRDVGTSNTPLIGLAGRIGDYFDAGSHPGPLSFWLMAPIYRLLGASAFAFAASAVLLHSLAVALALWLGYRRGGVPVMAGVAAVLALLIRFYGPTVFFEPWNPYLPVLWWVVTLLAAWSVLDDDLPMLPVFIVAGSFCAQTHLPYDGLVGGIVGLLGLVLVIRAVRAVRGGDGDVARRIVRWGAGALVLGVVLWLPPMIDQVGDTANLTKIRTSMSEPTEEITGLAAGAKEVLRNLDPGRLATGHMLAEVSTNASVPLPGVSLVLVWFVAAIISIRLRHRTLLRLHGLIAVVLLLAVVSASRVFGELWYYLFLWSWGLAGLMLLAVAWTLALLVKPELDEHQRPWLRPAVFGIGAVVAVLFSLSSAVTNRNAEPSRPDLSANLGVLARQTSAALASGDVAGGGKDGRYIVRWADPVTIGSQGIGLVNELERDGFEVGVDKGFGPGAVRHRVLKEAKATGVVQLVVGPGIKEWDRRIDAQRVAYVDSRSDAERAEFDRLDASIDQRLRAAGKAKIADEWARNLFTASLQPGIPSGIRQDMLRALTVGAPAAVYVQKAPAK